jgi:hypothetical protein
LKCSRGLSNKQVSFISGGEKLSPWLQPKASSAHPLLQRGLHDTIFPLALQNRVSIPLATHPAVEEDLFKERRSTFYCVNNFLTSHQEIFLHFSW